MGKSRLMKEIAKKSPTIYICLRSKESTGFPFRSPIIANWLLNPAKTQLSVFHRNDFQFPLLSTFKFCVFLLATIEEVGHWISNGKILKELKAQFGDKRQLLETIFQYEWLWLFFAEPPFDEPPRKSDSTLTAFWEAVETRCGEKFKAVSKSIPDKSCKISSVRSKF
jgi:hypothetical protein